MATPTDPTYTVVVVAVVTAAVVVTVVACIPPLWRALNRAADRCIDRLVAAALDEDNDPVDRHFDTAVTDPRPWYEISPTCADLRADWARWEREVRS